MGIRVRVRISVRTRIRVRVRVKVKARDGDMGWGKMDVAVRLGVSFLRSILTNRIVSRINAAPNPNSDPKPNPP